MLAHPQDCGMAAPMAVPSSTCAPDQQQSMFKSNRPKLSLNTTQARTFGKGSSLRLDMLSAISPTVRNTFSNADEPNHIGPKPLRSVKSLDNLVASRNEIPLVEHDESRTPRTPSTSSTSPASTLSEGVAVPYKIAHNVRPILLNSPFPRLESRRMSIQRPMFPAQKRVAFRTPLAEEIKNTKYTLAHSDIVITDSLSRPYVRADPSNLSPNISSSTMDDYPASSLQNHNQPQLHPNFHFSSSLAANATSISTSPLSPKRRSRRITTRLTSPQKSSRSPTNRFASRRDSSPESDSDSCPETPVAGRRKHQREWTWTLGPLPGYNNSEDNPVHSSHRVSTQENGASPSSQPIDSWTATLESSAKRKS